MITAIERKQIKEKGYADIGGLPRNTYWTPDGKEISAIPSMRTYEIIEKGKVVESGIRDANLDKGWLTEKPVNPKISCSHCNYWHDTEKDVRACGIKIRERNGRFELLARKMRKEDEPELEQRVNKLASDIETIKSMLSQLLKKGE